MLLVQSLPVFWWQWQYISLFWHAVAMVGQVSPCPSQISRSPMWQELRWPREVEKELYNSSGMVQGAGAEEGNTSKGKEYGGLVPGPQLGRKRCPVQCICMDRHTQMCSACTPKMVRYKPAPVQATLTLCCPSFNTYPSAALQRSHGNCICPYRYTPEPTLKGPWR